MRKHCSHNAKRIETWQSIPHIKLFHDRDMYQCWATSIVHASRFLSLEVGSCLMIDQLEETHWPHMTNRKRGRQWSNHFWVLTVRPTRQGPFDKCQTSWMFTTQDSCNPPEQFSVDKQISDVKSQPKMRFFLHKKLAFEKFLTPVSSFSSRQLVVGHCWDAVAMEHSACLIKTLFELSCVLTYKLQACLL